MDDFPTQKITIYHKNGDKWDRYVKEASYRNTSILNRNKNGSNSTDKALIRIFDIKGYEVEWFAEENDIIVSREVKDRVTNIPLTYLSKKYGKSNVHKIVSVDKLIFMGDDADELEHIKIGAI